ncbi:MAG TPA: DegT/DnrJ/EryC1/StrS family aminotransferase [Polyangiaceae bacterium]|nr:DegT/DnrJ/EryC1/StrS family aminotransferase [Polyangiaceae bacterium]
MKVPLFDLRPQQAPLALEISHALTQFLDNPRFILSEPVEQFERAVADFLGVKHAIGVSSGTDALLCGLTALGIGAGDEVITTPFTFAATAEAILRSGATPVFADIEPHGFNIDPRAVAALVTARTRAILPVHLFGAPAELGELVALASHHKLVLLEDAAQAFGARYRDQCVGTFGALGAFSFFPTKPLGGFGDGGMLVTNDDQLAQRCRQLRSHGKNDQGQWAALGGNFRLDALQAAVLSVKLPHVPQWQAERARLAAKYNATLADCVGLKLPPMPSHVASAHALYTVRVKAFAGSGKASARDTLRAALRERGVETGVYYGEILPNEPLLAAQVAAQLAAQRSHPQQNPTQSALPEAETAAGEVLSLPLFVGMTDEQQHWVIEVMRQLCGA